MSVAVDAAYGCSNVFYLIGDQPRRVHSENGVANQQYYRVEDSAPWDPDCDYRVTWATASSTIGFVALWAQYVPSQQRWEMRFGTYLWSVPGL